MIEPGRPLRPPAGRGPLDALARWRPRFEDPAFSVGSWVESWTDEEGRIHTGWFEYGPEALQFRRDVAEQGWIQAFDWSAWMQSPEGARVLRSPEGIERATPEDLVRVLTAIIRSDRFVEGSFAGAFESGLLVRILRRAEAIAEDLATTAGPVEATTPALDGRARAIPPGQAPRRGPRHRS